MASVEELPRHDTMSLKILEALIVAGLRSRRQRIANRTIEMWNKTFGAQDSLEYPPLVEERLRRIRLVADLRLPEFPESSDNDVGQLTSPSKELKLTSGQDEEPIPTFEDSQEDTVQAHPPLEFRGPFPLPKRLNGTASSSPAPSNPTPSRRTQAPSSSSKPKAKLRHDDSQIEFAPIHSSPVGEATLDSQVLTDHQKEVREKQQHAAAMFPDISSSPAKQIKDKRLDLAAYAKPGKYSSLSEDAEPRSTPILNLQEYGGNQDVPSSSPTPRSRRENREDAVSDGPYLTSSAAEAFVETNIPSSPPGLDDENELPADSSIVNETILKNEVSTEAARANHFNTLEEELGEEVVDQLVGDVTNLSDTNLTQFQRASSQISVSSPDSESEMGSSDIEVEVSQQLENEVIAQALRHRDALSNARKQNLLDDATANGNQQALNGDTAGNLLDDLLGDGENISSFDDIAADLPQGTACTGSEPVQKIVLEDLRGTPASPTEKDTSSIDLPIRSSPAKTKSRPETIEQNLAADETVVEDSFVALDATRDASGFQKEPNTQSKQPPPKASRHKKRKSETILDLNNISKRPKKKDSLSSLDVPDAKRSQYTGSESDSDDSLLSNIHVETSSDGLWANAKASFSKAHHTTSSQSSRSKSRSKNAQTQEKMGRQSAEQVSSSPRASPRLSGSAAEQALTRFRKRKSGLSQSQTTEPDLEEERDASVVDEEESVEEAPAPKKRRGRLSKAPDSRASSQASNAPSSIAKTARGPHSRSDAFPAPSSTMMTEMEGDTSRSGPPQDTPDGSRATREVATQRKKRRRSYDKKGGAGGTTGDETQAGKATASQEDARASQGSTTSNGREGKTSDERPKLQPKSIIERLKRVLSDCKQMVLGKTEEREIDDVIFDLRLEVHAAARRGVEESGK